MRGKTPSADDNIRTICMVEQGVQRDCFTNPTILAHLCLQSQAWLTWPPLALRAPPLQSSTRRVVFNGIQNIFATFKVYYRSSFCFFSLKKQAGVVNNWYAEESELVRIVFVAFRATQKRSVFAQRQHTLSSIFLLSRTLLIYIFILHRVWWVGGAYAIISLSLVGEMHLVLFPLVNFGNERISKYQIVTELGNESGYN